MVEARALQFDSHGEPLDVLRDRLVDVAEPLPGRIRVRVSAVGLNPADWALCRGYLAGDLPRGIGYDVAGTVEAVGDLPAGHAGDVAVGDRVFGTADFAGQPSAGAADVAILDGWHHLPAGMSPVAAAALPMVVQTAVWTLDAIGPAPDGTLLIHGAGAMVGFAATQIALRRGLRVIATAGLTFADRLTGFGAVVTGYGPGLAGRVRDISGGPVDRVLDTAPPAVGTIAALLPTVADPAHVMTIANHDEARRLGARVNLDHLGDRRPTATFLPEYAELALQGGFHVPIAHAHPFDRWRDAVELSLSGRPRGKVMLIPGAS